MYSKANSNYSHAPLHNSTTPYIRNNQPRAEEELPCESQTRPVLRSLVFCYFQHEVRAVGFRLVGCPYAFTSSSVTLLRS